MQCYPCVSTMPARRLKQRVISLDQVIDYAADFFGVNVEDFFSKRRFPDLVRAKFITIDYLIRMNKYSLKGIGNALNKNHASIINARDQLPEMLKKYPEMEQQISDFNEWMHHKVYR